MKRTLDGVVVSLKMQKAAVVNVMRKYPHTLYKKIMKKDNKIHVDTANFKLNVGDVVKIVETTPISKTKHFKIMEVAKSGSA